MEVASMMPVQNYNPSLQYAQYHDMRTPISATAMNSSMMNSSRQAEYHNYHPSQHTPSDSPPTHVPTPPEDPNKPSLPSISNLLGIADGEKSSQASSESRSPPQKFSPPATQQPTPIEGTPSAQYHSVSDNLMINGSQVQKPTFPPTPPMRAESMHDGVNSPSTISSHSSFSGPSHHHLGAAMNNMDAAQQRVYMPAMHMAKQHPGPQAMYSASPYPMHPYMASPVSASGGSYYSPEAVYQNGMYHQRPLPSNFHPAMIAAPMLPPGVVATANPWEHHHYLSAANQPFPSVQDRYVCTTCKKAFSRPSSLKIHSHSHTGEKPFKCPHPGCGKAFSVRSNMKRHERGCHTPEMSAFSSS
ncbi:hypothetical protein CAC42_6646 [Sphaceloma murrayae]|uniref:C2H2-type domain-containing protein n=1 Tax=Sphaceloma murrayae TaxID=2082308 RepID=A0A2K1QH03_9PEZI|nr:hypothetical protein CAC42_6646 [Sphaceloma murrayae]